MAGTAPFDWGAAKDALYTWLYGQLAISVIWADQDAPRPAYPYATLKIIAGPTPTSYDEERWEDEAAPGTGVKVITVGDREITVSVQAYVSFEGEAYDHDADASHYMSIAHFSLSMETVRLALRAAGLLVRDVLPIVNLSGATQGGQLSRASFDIRCGLAFRVEPATYGDSINTVVVSSDISGQAGATDLDMDEEEIGG